MNVWDYMDNRGLTVDNIVSEVSSRNDAIEYGWKLGVESMSKRAVRYQIRKLEKKLTQLTNSPCNWRNERLFLKNENERLKSELKKQK